MSTAKYKLTQSPDMVIRIEDGASIPRGHRWWDDYEAWLADGNTPEPFESATTLESLRAAARERINVWRNQQERAVVSFPHADHRWDGGLVVRERLNTTLGTLKAFGVPAGFFWTDADNIDVPMTQLELQALYEAHERAIFGQGWKIHQRQRELKRQVDAAGAVWLRAFVPDWPVSA
ncbi:DUF4376 domain-containing protein [Jeongeupia wiesaeckerbachi]|uniref:DUF4376 domain-containing protein n=1 Tax=Jeongeupia wiesaeckerbachi TaxID=3051218 RepID=UPI003D80497A